MLVTLVLTQVSLGALLGNLLQLLWTTALLHSYISRLGGLG